MSKPYKIIHLFENTDTLILEVNRVDRLELNEISLANHWLFYDKISKGMIKLWFRSGDASSEIEERYFEQGYLKFNKIEATYIEKFNSAQYKLSKSNEAQLDQEVINQIEVLFRN